MIKGVIFDMDGIILDSVQFFYRSFDELFMKKYKINVSKELFSSLLGGKAEHGIHTILDKNNLEGNADDLRNEWEDYVHKHGPDEIKLMAGIRQVLSNLHKEYKLALATGNIESFARKILEEHDLIKYFDVIMTGDHVDHAKPNPEIFLKAAKKLNLKNNECVVIEDAELGLIAAKKGGMFAISIPNDFTNKQDHNMADLHLSSIKELNSSTIRKLGDTNG